MNNSSSVETDSSIFDRHLDDFQKLGIDIDTIDESVPTTKGYGFMIDHDDEGLDRFEIRRGRIDLRKGKTYLNKSDNRHYELVEYLNESTEVVVRSVETGKTSIVNIQSLSNIKDQNNDHINVDISAIGDEEWQKAQSKFEAIKPIINTEHSYNHRKLIMERSKEINVSIRSLYRWIKQYQTVGSIAGLVEKKRGWKEGGSRLTKVQDDVIQRAIKAFYLTKQRASLEQTYREVFRICSMEKIDKPSKKAIKLRIDQISEYEQLKKRGQIEQARKKFNPTPHSFPNADYPLSVIQIDHTPVDLMLVDNEHRKSIGRPYLTLAIDVYSRMITGYYLSLDPPSATSVAMCVARSILQKESLLLEHGIDHTEWQVYGYPQKIHVDNGADFRSNTLARSCEIHGINLEFRPVARPQFGGHIERLIGTFMKEVHGINGTTFSNIKEKDNYDSEKEATLTLDEFEVWLLTFITKVYHKRIHSTLGRSPTEQWYLGIHGDGESIGTGLPSLPEDSKTLLLDFMPSFERTIQHFGVTIDSLRYYDPCLNIFINAKNKDGSKKHFLFRRDPRDISKIWFYDPSLHQYFTVPFANQQLPSMSLWEYKQIRKQISDKGNEYINEHQIYEALTEMRDLIEDSSKKTKSARRQAQRQKTHAKSQTIVAKTIMASKRNNANTSSDLEPTNSDDIQTNLQPSIQASKKPEKSVVEQNGLLLDTTDFDFGDIE